MQGSDKPAAISPPPQLIMPGHFVCVLECADKLKDTETLKKRENIYFLLLLSSLTLKVHLNCRCPSFASLPLHSCLTSFNALPRLDKKTTQGGACTHVCVCVCVRACTVLSCDLVPSWQQRAVNRGPLSHKESATHTHNSQSMPDCRPPTAHLACCYYVTSVLCVCVHLSMCDCVSPADTICSVLCELVSSPCSTSLSDTFLYSPTTFPLYSLCLVILNGLYNVSNRQYTMLQVAEIFF